MQLNAHNPNLKPKSKSKSKKAHCSKSHPAKLVADKLQGWTRTKGKEVAIGTSYGEQAAFLVFLPAAI
jgi:hypothetical protein